MSPQPCLTAIPFTRFPLAHSPTPPIPRPFQALLLSINLAFYLSLTQLFFITFLTPGSSSHLCPSQIPQSDFARSSPLACLGRRPSFLPETLFRKRQVNNDLGTASYSPSLYATPPSRFALYYHRDENSLFTGHDSHALQKLPQSFLFPIQLSRYLPSPWSLVIRFSNKCMIRPHVLFSRQRYRVSRSP